MATPELATDLGLGPALATALTVGAGGLLAFFAEPWLLLRLQGRPAHRVTAAALALFALELLACAWAPHPLVVVIALLLGGPASGVACAFAQATLAELHRRADGGEVAAERATARWALAAALGDIAAPLLLVAVGNGWRAAYAIGAVVAGTLALLVLRTRSRQRGGAGSVPSTAADEEEDTPRFTLRELLAARGVLLATLAATCCTFLDEIVLAVGAFYLGDRWGLDASTRSLVLGGWTLAALAGSAVVTFAVERVTTARLLLASGLGCALSLGAALLLDQPALALVLLLLGGFLEAAHWPLCQALALRAAGDRPLLAGAAAALWNPLDLAIPFLLAGWLATAGSTAAMAVLLIQPLAMVAAAATLGRAMDHGTHRAAGQRAGR